MINTYIHIAFTLNSIIVILLGKNVGKCHINDSSFDLFDSSLTRNCTVLCILHQITSFKANSCIKNGMQQLLLDKQWNQELYLFGFVMTHEDYDHATLDGIRYSQKRSRFLRNNELIFHCFGSHLCSHVTLSRLFDFWVVIIQCWILQKLYAHAIQTGVKSAVYIP